MLQVKKVEQSQTSALPPSWYSLHKLGVCKLYLQAKPSPLHVFLWPMSEECFPHFKWPRENKKNTSSWQMKMPWNLNFVFLTFYRNTTMLICLHVVHGCFHATMAELNICNRSCTAWKSKVFTIWPFTEIFSDPCYEHSPPFHQNQE